MIVVADTSPLNYLVQLGLDNLLPQLFGQIIVPPAVLTELQHPGAPAEVRAWAFHPPLWLIERKPSRLDEMLHRSLGVGEREAISFAIELRANVLLIDELAGRRKARSRQLQVAGTLAILFQASQVGWLSLPETLQRLKGFGFRISSKVEEDILAFQSAKKR